MGVVEDAAAVEINATLGALAFAERTRDATVSPLLYDAQERMADELRVYLGYLVIKSTERKP